MKTNFINHSRIFYWILLASISLYPIAQLSAQSNANFVVSGKVTDATGNSLSGVNVLVKGTQTGTLTSFEGDYTLKASPDAILIFSFMGFQTREVSVSKRNHIDIKLNESSQNLDEIVVIGYGTTTKKEITGAVTTLKSDAFNKGVYNNPMGLIQGKVAGLSITKPNGADPMAGYQILLRGTNTLTSGQGPLIIIDGVIGADLKNVNFQDIESFDVLKDGSAAAIYGTRGSNGVIIITTKAAKRGKGTFEFSSQISTQVAPRGVKNLTADEFKYAIETYQPSKAGSLFGSNTDWFKEVTNENPISFENHLSFSGGTETFSQRLSLTHVSNQGLLQKNEAENLIIKANLIQKVFDDKLTFDFNVTNNIRTYSPANYEIFRQAFIQNPTQPVYDNSNPATGGYSFKQGLEYYNPVAMLNERTREGKTTDILLSLRAKLKVTNSLIWDNFIATQKSDWEDSSYKTKYYPTIIGINGEADIANGRNSNSQFESVLTYNKSFDKHNLQAIAGYSYQEYEMNSSFIGNSNFDTDLFLYNNIAAGSYFREGKGELGSYKESSTLIAFFNRVMYNYDGKYLASASIRNEGSSKFGTDNKWGLFPSLSLGWRLSEEAFLKDVNWINSLKLRVGYGVTGNQDFSPYRSQLLLERVGSLYYNQQWINSYGPGQNPNPDLKWETKNELNIGIDFSVLNKRLSGSIEYYVRKTEDLLWEFQVSVPPYLYPTLFTNVGTISNRGIELTLNSTLIKNDNFQWNSTLTASHNKNYLDKISNSEFTQTSYETAFIGGTVGVWTQRIQEGQELGTFYGPVWLGVKDGYDVFKNQNPIGEVDKSKWENLGSANPDAIIGWSNDLSYKNWNLGFVFRAGIGGKVLNSYRLYYESWNNIGLRNIVHIQLENPEFIGNITYSSKYLEDASFLKLDNITLNYNFNIESKYISGLNIFGSAQNVFWITKYKGIDPEVNQGGLEPGIDRLSYYPRTTSLSIGIKAAFK
ncbi:SusC/RagA family TonB-linked outer membrane protein [Lutibacter sp.]|uniref:SusC/RagA family TonB-linked outer membrane protein n=1 Tax=Lutibacter sp. TaxID=1925666 RepID=UPI0027340CB1|nr:SusC/RagA family TonB-linked outer membrane protein [Lutibacter sp.]MDP3313125.1 SusC/RagA family TonB-linked outer membrane protein [Lutibacter sp.]